jgi:hypothetical protein
MLGEGAFAPAEYLVTWLKLLHVSANRFNRPRYVISECLVFWFLKPGC